MSVIRGPRQEQDFTVFGNEVLRDKSLSFRARGLLVYVLSQPPDFHFTSAALADAAKEGREAVRTALTELEEAGYLVRERRRLSDGRWDHVAVMHERPSDGKPETESWATVPPADTRESAGHTSAQETVVGNLGDKSRSTSDEELPKNSLSIAYGADVERLCALLADLIEANGSKRPTVTAAWRVECERMIRLDNRKSGEIERAIRWSQSDNFWRANILSMPKLRQKYDSLRLRSIEQKREQRAGPRPKDEATIATLEEMRAERRRAETESDRGSLL